MSCTYAFLGLPKGRCYKRPCRITCCDDAIFLNFIQGQVEAKMGCYFYNFNPEFYVDEKHHESSHDYYRYLKFGLSNCPGYSYGIAKAKAANIHEPLEGKYTIQITLYKGCCAARSFTICVDNSLPSDDHCGCSDDVVPPVVPDLEI